MTNFNTEFKKVLNNLETNITEPNDLNAAKVEMFNLYNLFFDEFTNLEQTINNRMAEIAQSQLNIIDKLKIIEKSVNNIEKDIYLEDNSDDEDCDVEVKCPYCNAAFTAEMNDLTAEEIICPECNNTIELDWGEDCDCNCADDCDCCSHEKHDCHCDEEDDE